MIRAWWEIAVTSDAILEEIICWRLDTFGCSGTAVEMKNNFCLIKAYIPQIKVQALDLANLSDEFEQDSKLYGCDLPTLSYRLVDEEDWANSWKQYWNPTPIGNNFIVYPAWLTPPENSKKNILRLDPASAFGTGTHQTTQLCLESLEILLKSSTKDLVIADIGCGSGILSIGSLLLGAKKVYAVDTDILAVQATVSNCNLNQIDPSSLVVNQGSAENLIGLAGVEFDGIVCNILAEVIIKIMPEITQLGINTTWLILSGLLESQADQVSQCALDQGWVVKEKRVKSPWCSLSLYRNLVV